MEEIEVWTVDGSLVTRLAKSNRMESELLLEDTLVNNPDLLMEGLTLVGRQTPTEGGPLDLLGVDRKGRLVVFELKRGTLSRDAIAQIIDYASYLSNMELDDLTKHVSENSGKHGINKIENFQEWHSQSFDELESLNQIRMFLVGLGVDDRTERMVSFLADNIGMDISLLTFHGFEYDGKTLLAKQVEVGGSDDIDDGPSGGGLSPEERWDLLNGHIERCDVREPFNDMRSMFRENWGQSSEYIGAKITKLLVAKIPDF